MSKIITDDKDKRQSFKERVNKRVVQTLTSAPSDSETMSEKIDVNIPSNFYKFSDLELYGYLKDQKLTPEQANEVIEQIHGLLRVKESKFRIVVQDPAVRQETISVEEPEPVPVVKIEVPADFKSQKNNDKYLYLTRECSLTPEQASDVLDVLTGKAPFSGIEYDIVIKEKEVLPNPLAGSKTLNPIRLTLPHDFSSLKRVYQESVLVKEYELSLSEVREVLSVIDNKPITNREIELSYRNPPVKQEPVSVLEPEPVPIVNVEVPADFKSYRDSDKYLYLTKECVLSPEQANDVMDILIGKTPLNKIDYNIEVGKSVSFFNPLAEKRKLEPIDIVLPHNFSELRRAHQESVLVRGYGFSLSEVKEILSFIDDKPISNREIVIGYEEPPPVETVAPKPEPSYPEIVVDLPNRFQYIQPQDQYLFLKNELKLTGDQANDVISACRGQNPVYNKVVINYKDQEAQTESFSGLVERNKSPIELLLPHDFTNLRRYRQESVLVKEFGLSLSELREVMAVVDNKPISNRKIVLNYEEPPTIVEPVLEPEPLYPEVVVDLPDKFKNLRPQEQFLFLKHDLKLTSEQANDVISAYRGKIPVYNKVVFV